MSSFRSLTTAAAEDVPDEIKLSSNNNNNNNNNKMPEEDEADEKDEIRGKRATGKEQNFAATSVCLASSTFGINKQHCGQISVKLVRDFDSEDCGTNFSDENRLNATESTNIDNLTLPRDDIRDPVSNCVEKLRQVSKGVLTVWKIIALYLVIILMFGVVYIYTAPSDIKEEFNVTVVERNMNPILLSVSYHKSEQVVLLRSLHPIDFTETLFDFEQDLVAHRNLASFRCYVRSAVSPQFLPEYEELKELVKNNADLTWTRPSEAIQMLVLKTRVNAKVLRDVAGSNVAEFCQKFKTHWLISYGRADEIESEKSTDVPSVGTSTETGSSTSYPLSPRTYTSLIQSSLYMILLRHKVTGG